MNLILLGILLGLVIGVLFLFYVFIKFLMEIINR